MLSFGAWVRSHVLYSSLCALSKAMRVSQVVATLASRNSRKAPSFLADFASRGDDLRAGDLRLEEGGSVSTASTASNAMASPSFFFVSSATKDGLRARFDRRAVVASSSAASEASSSSSSDGSRSLLDRCAFVASSSRLDTNSSATAEVFLLDRLVGVAASPLSSAGALDFLAERDFLRELLFFSGCSSDSVSFSLAGSFASGGNFRPAAKAAFSVGFLVRELFLRWTISSGGDFRLPTAEAAAFFPRELFLRGGASLGTLGVCFILTCPSAASSPPFFFFSLRFLADLLFSPIADSSFSDIFFA
mmetsp:Transcript_8013/g.14459  ORF Transcript_8013/g.14459 Transcript_8013/m.14459 type:complete len:305 (-) Transcript_8013:651-1565(-)